MYVCERALPFARLRCAPPLEKFSSFPSVHTVWSPKSQRQLTSSAGLLCWTRISVFETTPSSHSAAVRGYACIRGLHRIVIAFRIVQWVPLGAHIAELNPCNESASGAVFFPVIRIDHSIGSWAATEQSKFSTPDDSPRHACHSLTHSLTRSLTHSLTHSVPQQSSWADEWTTAEPNSCEAPRLSFWPARCKSEINENTATTSTTLQGKRSLKIHERRSDIDNA